MIPYILTYLTYNDVYTDKPPTLEEIQNFFSTFHTPHLIQALCKLNIAIWKANKDLTIHTDILHIYFSEADFNKIQVYRKKNIRMFPVALHRHQVLLAIKLALLKPNFEEAPLIKLKEFGRYFLAISEYINQQNLPSTNLLTSINYEYGRRSMAKLAYFSHYGEFIHNYERALKIWLEIPFTDRGKALISRFKIDIHKEFFETTGLTIEEYLGVSFLYLFHLFDLDPRTAEPIKFLFNRNFFENTILSQEKKDALFMLLSQDIDKFRSNYEIAVKTKLNAIDRFENNFLPLIDAPVININSGLSVVSDPTYLEEKVTHGIYWILHNKYIANGNKKRADALSSAYGMLHQEYIYQSLINICDEVIEVPVDTSKKKEKRADFIGIIKRADEIYLLVIESKKIALPLPLVLDSDRAETVKKLEQIFYDSGFRQVFNIIRKIQKGELKDLKMEHINTKKVKLIFPLLATDRFIVEESLNRKLYEDEFLGKLFMEIPIMGNIPVAHPMFLSSEEFDRIEAIVEVESKFEFIRILATRHELLKKRLDQPQLKQFIPGMFILGEANIPKNLETFWNFLFTYKKGVFHNQRLDKTLISTKEKVTIMLFGKEAYEEAKMKRIENNEKTVG